MLNGRPQEAAGRVTGTKVLVARVGPAIGEAARTALLLGRPIARTLQSESHSLNE